MTFLPVVTRELRVAARKPRTFWVRFFAALVATVLFFWIWLTLSQSYNSGRQGTSLFSGLSGLAMAYALFIGVTTSDCISEEKREGTLGLLFLTDLRGFDVVLGKLVATSLNSFYGLIAIFPLLAVPLLLGGVSVGEFWRMVLVLCVTLFFSLSCGMVCSAFSKSDRKARGATVLLILLFAGVIPFVHSIRTHWTGPPGYTLLATAPYTYALAFDAQYAGLFHSFWISIGVISGLSLLLLGTASVAVPKLWQDRPAGVYGNRWLEWWRTWNAGEPAASAKTRGQLLDINPFLWLGSRPMLKRAYPFGFLLLVTAIWLWLAHKYPRDMREGFVYVIAMLLIHTVLKWWVASEASRLFAEDRRSGAWELTLSTSLTVNEIIHGQLLALSRQFLIPAVVILFADLWMTAAGARSSGGAIEAAWISFCAAGMLVFAVDLVTISWVGMWLGLKSSKSGKAASGVITRILALPWVLFIGILSLGGIAKFTISFALTWQMALGLWVFLSVAVDLLFGSGAARNLRQHFRELATTRFEIKPNFFRKGADREWRRLPEPIPPQIESAGGS